MIKLNKRTDAVAYAVLLAAGLCANDALAFTSYGNVIANDCASAGSPVSAADTCDTCHGNRNAQSAYDAGGATLIDFYCPVVTPPPPPPPPPPEPTCTDNDGDGFTVEGSSCGTPMDCNDNNPAINPGATESCTDGIDNNCNNRVDTQDPNAAGCPVVNCTDMDGDTYAIEGGVCGPVDCNDSDPNMNPGEIEICDDGFDNNCNIDIDAADAACQAMEDGNDPVLEDRHEEERRRRGGYSGSYYNRDDDEGESRRARSSDDEGESRRARSSDDEGESRRARSSDDEGESRRARSSDDEGESRRARSSRRSQEGDRERD